MNVCNGNFFWWTKSCRTCDGTKNTHINMGSCLVQEIRGSSIGVFRVIKYMLRLWGIVIKHWTILIPNSSHLICLLLKQSLGNGLRVTQFMVGSTWIQLLDLLNSCGGFPRAPENLQATREQVVTDANFWWKISNTCANSNQDSGGLGFD